MGLALSCLGLSLLFLFFPSTEVPPVDLETNEKTGSVIQLAPGSTFQRELGPGAQEVIGVWAGQGKFLRFTIDKGDLVLSTVLYGPTGTNLTEHVSQELETVEISFPVDVAGLYKIELRSRETAETRRPFELKIYPLTSITDAGRKDSEARHALGDGEVLRAAWTRASLVEAVEKYDQATQLWTSVYDFSDAAMAAIKAGDVCFRLNQYPEAQKRFENAAKLSRQTGDRISEARALDRIGHLYSFTGDNERAYATLNKALTLLGARQSNAPSIASHVYAEVLSDMAEVIYGNGNLLKARNYFERARKMLPDDRKGQARTHLFCGYIAGSVGQTDKAREDVSKALALYRATGDQAGEGFALIASGLFYTSKTKEDESVKLHREAAQIFQSIGDRQGEALAGFAIGQASETRGDHVAALQHYENSLGLYESIGTLDFVIAALYKIGAVHASKNKLDRALTYYQRALDLSRSTKKSRLEVLVLQGIAFVYKAQGDTEGALKHLRTVLKFYQNTSDVRGQAVALNEYGDLLLKLGQKQEALAVYERARPLSEQVGDTRTLLTTLYNLSRAHLSLGSFERALSIVEDSIKTIEQLRDDVGSPDLRALYFATVKKHYDLWVDVLMHFHRARPGQGYDVQALLVSDRSRARSLIDLLSESHADLPDGVSAELLERERELRGLISVQAQYRLELSLTQSNAEEAAETANAIAQLRAEYQEIQGQLWKQTPKLLSLRSFAPTTLADIQDELRDSDTMLLQYALGDERSYLWAVTANSFQSYELPPRTTIEGAAREVYPLLTARQSVVDKTGVEYQAGVDAADNQLPQKANNLSRMLLGPIAPQLGNRKLLILTEGALQSIPFEALPAPSAQSGPINWDTFIQSLLINTNEISSSPSIATLRAIRSEKKKAGSPDRSVAVIADPVFSGNDDRVRSAPMSPVVADASVRQGSNGSQQGELPSVLRGGTLSRLTYSSVEADAISAAAPRGTSMIVKGFDANRETLMSSRIGEYQIIHFATHAFLDREHPEMSGIVLTLVDPRGMRRNGLMPLHDVYSLNLSSELTVLSACQTALGQDISGEGYLGLTHSFLSAGSKSVVASLWKVEDRATADLMTKFYEAMLHEGMSTGAALRAAKLKTMKENQWRAPYFWAGFVLQGEYTNHIAVEHESRLNPGWVVLGLVVLAASVVIVFRRRRRQSARA